MAKAPEMLVGKYDTNPELRWRTHAEIDLLLHPRDGLEPHPRETVLHRLIEGYRHREESGGR